MKVLIERLMGKILTPVDGWKSIIGIVGIAGLMVAQKMGWIDTALFDAVYPYFKVVFGVGIIHKVFKHDNGTGSAPVR